MRDQRRHVRPSWCEFLTSCADGRIALSLVSIRRARAVFTGLTYQEFPRRAFSESHFVLAKEAGREWVEPYRVIYGTVSLLLSKAGVVPTGNATVRGQRSKRDPLAATGARAWHASGEDQRW